MVTAQIPIGMIRLKIHSKGMYCLKGIVELPGQDQRLSWGMSSCPSSKESLTSIHPSSRAGSATAVREPNSNPLPRQPPLPVNNFEKYSHISFVYVWSVTSCDSRAFEWLQQALKILTPALNMIGFIRKGLPYLLLWALKFCYSRMGFLANVFLFNQQNQHSLQKSFRWGFM